MTETDLKRVRFILEAKRTELTGSLCHREEIAIEKAPDTLDEVQLAAQRELAIRNLDRDSGRLRLIRMALDRIAGGSYGVCLRCEEEISPKRVHALPWAAFCIGCQEQMDNDQIVLYGSATRLAGAA
jgi:DnaK suppressor protein